MEGSICGNGITEQCSTDQQNNRAMFNRPTEQYSTDQPSNIQPTNRAIFNRPTEQYSTDQPSNIQ
jgi:hypothetical protein